MNETRQRTLADELREAADSISRGRRFDGTKQALLDRAAAALEEHEGVARSFLSMCPSAEGLGGHAPIGAILSLAPRFRAALRAGEGGAP